jgi:hypothetical protein
MNACNLIEVSESFPIPVISSQGRIQLIHEPALGVNFKSLIPVPVVDKVGVNHKLSIGLLNCQSVKNKATIISDFLCENDLDVLLLNETWLRSGATDKRVIGDLVPDGYSFKHKARNNGSRGGGVGILFRDSLSYKQKPSSINASSFESMEGYFSTPGSCIHIALIYRIPPSTKNKLSKSLFLEEFTSLLEHLCILPGKVLIIGDFNIHWDDQNNAECKHFMDILDSFDLVQHVDFATHIGGHTLDFIISRSGDNIIDAVSPGDMIADHSAVLASLNMHKPKSKTKIVKYRRIKAIKIDKFSEEIKPVDQIFSTDVNSLTDHYNAMLQSALDIHAPEKSKSLSIRKKVPWYSEDITAAKLEKRRLERKWRCTKLEIHRQLFTQARNKFVHLVNSEKSKFFNSEIANCAGDQKKLYTILTDILHQKDKPTLPAHDCLSDLVNTFSQYFVSKIERIRSNIPRPNISPSSGNTTETCSSILNSFEPVIESDIEKIVKNMKNASCPLDPIPTALLKQCSGLLLPTITKIVNQSLASGIFPSSLKHALVRPLLKKSHLDPEDLKNYRPISNLAFLSKVIEKVVVSHLSQHMSDNNLHEELQSAYKANHSPETALVRVQNDILLELDRKRGVVLVLLDLSAAFDTIDHDILIEQLSSRLGVKGIALAWFKSYLSNRTQTVFIDGTKSNIIFLLFGIPQGSVLGPFLFTVYTLPLADIIRRHGLKYHLYADDTQLYLSFDVLDNTDFDATLTKIHKCLNEIKAWMDQNMLKLNQEKTEVLLLTSPHYKNHICAPHFTFGQADIIPAPAARNIGINFDSNLIMADHINTICKSARYHLRKIGAIRKFITKEACIQLVHAFIRSEERRVGKECRSRWSPYH